MPSLRHSDGPPRSRSRKKVRFSVQAWQHGQIITHKFDLPQQAQATVAHGMQQHQHVPPRPELRFQNCMYFTWVRGPRLSVHDGLVWTPGVLHPAAVTERHKDVPVRRIPEIVLFTPPALVPASLQSAAPLGAPKFRNTQLPLPIVRLREGAVSCNHLAPSRVRRCPARHNEVYPEQHAGPCVRLRSGQHRRRNRP